MTSPSVRSSNTDFSGNLIHQFDMPATVESGDLIVLAAVIDGDPAVSNIASGWSLLGRFPNSADDSQLLWFGKIADGTEDGAEIDLYDVDVDEESAACIYVIQDFYGSLIEGTDYDFSAGATGNDAAPDPSEVTASWGAADNLVIAAYGCDRANREALAYPAGYSSGLTLQNGGSLGGSVAAAVKAVTSAAEDPGAFTAKNSEQWSAVALILRGVGGVAATEVAGSDTVNVADTGAGQFEIFVSAADTVNTADTATRVLVLQVAATDTINIADSGSAALEVLVSAADTVSVADSAAPQVSLQVAGSDTVNLADQSTTAPVFEIAGSDTVTLSDEASRQLTIDAQAADAITVADQSAAQVSIDVSGSDVVLVSDVGARNLVIGIDASDTVTLADAADLGAVIEVAGTDTVTLTVIGALDDQVPLQPRTIQATATVSDDIAMTATVSASLAFTTIVSADLSINGTL